MLYWVVKNEIFPYIFGKEPLPRAPECCLTALADLVPLLYTEIAILLYLCICQV